MTPSETSPRARWHSVTPLLFVAGGGVAGFAYYYFVGCQSGTCPITSNPYVSTLYGGLVGYLLGRR